MKEEEELKSVGRANRGCWLNGNGDAKLELILRESVELFEF